MIIGVCTLELRLEWSNSLKDKRREVKGLISRIQSKFKASAAEVDAQDEWRKAVVGVAVVTTQRRHADSILNEVVRYVEEHSEAELVSIKTEIL